MSRRSVLPMVAQIAGMLAPMGLDGISFGSKTIRATKPVDLKRLVGFGDHVEVGDVVAVSTFGKDDKSWIEDATPSRIVGLMKVDGKPRILYRTIDDGPRLSSYSGPVSRFLETDCYRLRLHKLSQAEVDTWFKTHRLLSDGRHDLPCHLGVVSIKNHVPVLVTRSGKHTHMALAVEVAGQMSGYDLTVAKKYNDSEKTVAFVTRATKKQPPAA